MITTTIGNKIKHIRSEENLTQSQLATKVKCTAGYISSIENNHVVPSFKVFIEILSVLGYEVVLEKKTKVRFPL